MMTIASDAVEPVYAKALAPLLELLGGRPIDALSYAELSAIAREWIAHVDQVLDSGTFSTKHYRATITDAARRMARRKFEPLWALVRPSTAFQKALLELFTMCRIRSSVLAYLSLQEGRHWDGPRCEFPHTARLILQSMTVVGKRPPISLAGSLFGFVSFRLALDPARHLRALYRTLLRPPSTPFGRIGMAGSRQAHRQLFAWKAGLLRLALRLVFVKGGSVFGYGVDRLLQTRSFKRNLAFLLLLLFPGAKSLSEDEWGQLFERIYTYFPPRFGALSRVMHADSLLNHGLIKLMKIAFGVIASRVATRSAHSEDEVEFIATTLQLAYSWGITYPLVDDLLDSHDVNDSVKRELAEALDDLFATPDWSSARVVDPVVLEAAERVKEVIDLAPAGRQHALRNVLRFLLEAHRRDSERKLSRATENVEDAVWADSCIKAAFIRIATMEICGTPVTGVRLAAELVSSLVNQLGDDLWDVEEDLSNDRVTPFTLHLRAPGARDPFRFFLNYCLYVARSESGERQLAMAIGVHETCRSFLESSKQVDRVGQLVQRVSRTLEELYAAPPDTMAFPHVDPDAVLFAMESSVLSPTPRHAGGA